MRVVLPREATGAEIVEAVKRAAERTGFSCKLNTENAFVEGSVKEVPFRHRPELEKRTGRFWGKTGLVIGQLENDRVCTSIEINCKVPSSDPMQVQNFVDKTNDMSFPKAEPYFKEFVSALFEELQKAESAPV